MTWFFTSLQWYGYLLFLGLIFFPLASRLFPRFVDRGYPFAKTIGIIIGSYGIYLLGIFRIVPFSKESIVFFLILMGILIAQKLRHEVRSIKALPKKQLLLIFGEEMLFFLAFITLVYIRGREPSIHGLEKFMDYGFIQSILRSTYFPPLDMWLSADFAKPDGYPINYYYFGHLTGAFLIKFSGVLPTAGYNFILATIFAQSITLSFSIGGNIVHLFKSYIQKKYDSPIHIVISGFITSFLVNLAGNLHPIYLLTKGYPNDHPEPFWGIFQSFKDVRATMAQDEAVYVQKIIESENLLPLWTHSYKISLFFDSLIKNAHYWYPNATRFIPFTIHEFPSYSYVVADLHGHVFDIPFVLTTLAFILTFFLHATEARHAVPAQKKSKVETSLMKRVINYLNMTPKDFFYAILFGFMVAIHYMTNAFDGPIYLLALLFLFILLYSFSLKSLTFTLTTGISFIIFSKPFSYFFTPFANSVGVNCSPSFLVKLKKLGPFLFESGNCQVSAPWMLFILWGFFWISCILFILFLLVERRHKRAPNPLDTLMMFLFGFGTLLIVIPEFFYAKDIYPAHFRANTMFKLGYQAFIMMSISSGYVIYRLYTSHMKFVRALIGIYMFFFMFVAAYPFLAFPSYYNGIFTIKSFREPPEIDGSLWLNNSMSQDKEIIDYINSDIGGTPVILEAQGDSYTDYNRISAYTGTPTIAGWWVHEWLWRGSSDIVGKRIPDIVAIYESPDLEYTRYLLNKYKVKYVVVSNIEREKYPQIKEYKFEKIGRKIFESKNKSGALYRVF